MPYPETMPLPRPCPSCGGKLRRTTADPEKPLGMVACSGCQFRSPIKAYVKNVQAEIIAKAKAHKLKAKG